MRPPHPPLPTRYLVPLLAVAASFVLAGGYVHLREWLDTYRHVPAEVPGAALVRVGFPINAALSVVLAAALAYSAARWSRFAPHVVIASAAFQAGSLGVLIATRRGSVVGWSEPSWTAAAEQTRAVQIGALLGFAASLVIMAMQRASRARSPRPGEP